MTRSQHRSDVIVLSVPVGILAATFWITWRLLKELFRHPDTNELSSKDLNSSLITITIFPQQKPGPGRPLLCLPLNTPLPSSDPTPPSPTAAPPPPAASPPPRCWARSTSIFTTPPLSHTHIRTRWPTSPPLLSGRTTASRRMSWSRTVGVNPL